MYTADQALVHQEMVEQRVTELLQVEVIPHLLFPPVIMLLLQINTMLQLPQMETGQSGLRLVLFHHPVVIIDQQIKRGLQGMELLVAMQLQTVLLIQFHLLLQVSQIMVIHHQHQQQIVPDQVDEESLVEEEVKLEEATQHLKLKMVKEITIQIEDQKEMHQLGTLHQLSPRLLEIPIYLQKEILTHPLLHPQEIHFPLHLEIHMHHHPHLLEIHIHLQLETHMHPLPQKLGMELHQEELGPNLRPGMVQLLIIKQQPEAKELVVDMLHQLTQDMELQAQRCLLLKEKVGKEAGVQQVEVTIPLGHPKLHQKAPGLLQP